MIEKVISGGQTGADRAALEVAAERGVATGGTAPKGYLTERGPDPSLAAFGVVEHASEKYPPRTYANVRDSDGTVWFGLGDSRGHRCTMKAVDYYKKPFLMNPDALTLRKWAAEHRVRVLNVAGPRASTMPGVTVLVKSVLGMALQRR